MQVLILNRMQLSTVPFYEWLSGSNARPVLFTSRDSINLSTREFEKLRGRYAGLEVFDDFGNGRVEWEAIKRHEERPFSHIVALSEYDLIRAASLRRRFNIAGQNLESALVFRDKVLMKERLVQAGIPVAPYCPLLNVTELIDFMEEQGAPAVVKPRNGAGSVGVRVIRSEWDLEDFLATGLTGTVDTTSTLMAEKFVEGELYHIDGLVEGGSIRFLWPSRYLTHGLAFLDGKPHGGYTLDPDNPLRRRLQDFVHQVLAALPMPKLAAFHAEVFHSDGKLVLNEVASRIGGGPINEMIDLAFGVHLRRSVTRGECGLHLDLPPELTKIDPRPRTAAARVLMPPRPGVLRRVPGRAPYPWLSDYRIMMEIGDHLSPADSSMSHVASFIISGDNEKALHDRVQTAADWFAQGMVIDPLPSANAAIPSPAPEIIKVAPQPLVEPPSAKGQRRLCC